MFRTERLTVFVYSIRGYLISPAVTINVVTLGY